MRPQMAFAAVLALVGVLVSAPVLLDDLVLRSGYLFHTNMDTLEITQTVALTEQPRINLTGGTVSIPASFSRRPRAGEALAALLKGGNVRLELTNPTFEIDLTALSGDEDTKPGPGPAPAGSVSPMLAAIGDATFERLAIKDGRVRITFKSRPQAVMEELNAEIIVKRKTALRFKGQFRYRGEVVAFDATLGSRLERRGGLRVPIKAQLWADAINATFEGRLDWHEGPALSATTADITVPSVRALARWLGAAWPSGAGLKDFGATGALEWSDGILSMRHGQYQLDGNEANGALQLNVSGARPALAGTLAANSIDLAVYLDDALEAETDPGGSLLARLRGVRQAAPALLGYLDADVRLSADKVSFSGLTAEHLAAGVALKSARLLFDLASLALPNEGQAHGELTIDGWATPPTFALHGAIGNVDLAAATTAVAGTELVSGSGDLSVNLKASGLSGLDLLSRLDGEIGVDLPKGGSAACSVTSILAAARSDQPGSADPCAARTPLGGLALAVRLNQGLLTLPPTTGGTGSAAGRLSGTIDLVTKILDLKLERPAGPGSEAPAAEAPITVKGRPEALKFAVPGG